MFGRQSTHVTQRKIKAYILNHPWLELVSRKHGAQRLACPNDKAAYHDHTNDPARLAYLAPLADTQPIGSHGAGAATVGMHDKHHLFSIVNLWEQDVRPDEGCVGGDGLELGDLGVAAWESLRYDAVTALGDPVGKL